MAIRLPARRLSRNGKIQVFVRGADNAIYQTSLQPDGTWAGWVRLGGDAASAPAVTPAPRRGRLLDLVVRGTDNQLYHRSYVPGARLVRVRSRSAAS